MRRAYILGPLLLLSLAFFVAAGLAPTDSDAILLAVVASLLPAAGLVAILFINAWRWKRMGRALGLVAKQSGLFPDMEGRYEGRRLVIARRTNPYGMGPRLTTKIRIEGASEVILPGLVADAKTVRGLLGPLVKRGADA